MNTVIRYFQATVQKYGEKIAVIDDGRQLTFSELGKSMKNTACHIHNRINNYNQPGAVFLPKGIDSIIAFGGILYSSNFYVPLDVKSPQSRIQGILHNLCPAFIITSEKYKNYLLSMGIEEKNIIFIEEVNHPCTYSESFDEEYFLNRIIDTDPAYVLFTSGSTGVPKGVVIPHRALIDHINWAKDCFQVNKDDTIGNQCPFYFDLSMQDIHLCLSTGATLVIIPEKYFTFPRELMEYVNRMGITMILWVPSVLVNIANLQCLDGLGESSLRKVLFCGEVMPTKQINYWRRSIPNPVYANLYGPTETTIASTYYILDREFNDDEPLPIGEPCRNTSVLILNEQNNETVEDETGELCIRGSSLALGYWNAPEKTRGSFIQNPISSLYPEYIYRTGDLVYRNSKKEIMFVGRKDSQIKHMGYRIELGEIESAVISLEGIENACAIYDKEKPEIILVYAAKQEISINDMKKKLIPLLPKYMIPSTIYWYEKLPLNANGKVDRKALQLALTQQK